MPYHRITITVSKRFKDALIRKLSELEAQGFIEEDNSLIAYFPDTVPAVTISRELNIVKAILEKVRPGETLTFEHTMVQDADWNESWKKGFRPIDVGERFTILPPWDEQRTGRINLVIDPGMAFGTGHHETTRSCLVLMEKIAGTAAKSRFLDLGTGTGLLAIAATRLGYRRVVAVDTDSEAIEAARRNLELNAVTSIELIEGDISMTTGTFDLIAANLISGALIGLAGEIASRLDRSGVAILSGILLEQGEEVLHAMAQAGLALRERLNDGKWTSFVVGRHRDPKMLSA